MFGHPEAGNFTLPVNQWGAVHMPSVVQLCRLTGCEVAFLEREFIDVGTHDGSEGQRRCQGVEEKKSPPEIRQYSSRKE